MPETTAEERATDLINEGRCPHVAGLARTECTQVEARGTGITLAPGTTPQLVVDAPRLVPFRADDVQAAGVDHLSMTVLPIIFDGVDTGSVR